MVATLGYEKEQKFAEIERIFKEDRRIVGTVLEESYENVLTSVPEYHREGLVSQSHSNETLKVESKYTIKLKTDDSRTIAVSIVDDHTKKESLDM